jgi:hypothetical protein
MVINYSIGFSFTAQKRDKKQYDGWMHLLGALPSTSEQEEAEVDDETQSSSDWHWWLWCLVQFPSSPSQPAVQRHFQSHAAHKWVVLLVFTPFDELTSVMNLQIETCQK